MGYSTEIIECSLSVPRKNLQAACQDAGVLAALTSRFHTPDISTPMKLLEAFIGDYETWNFEAFDANGTLVDLEYQDQRYSWISKCLNALAPFVPDGNWVEFVAEDHEYSRLYFKDGYAVEQKPVVTKVYPEVK